MNYIVARELNGLFIVLDIIFLIVLGYLLLKDQKRLPFIFGLTGAIIYFVVDYGGFYHLLGTRQVNGADTMWFLLWLSTSYGFTNFVWIWLFLDRDKKILKYSLVIVLGWLFVAFGSQLFGSSFPVIHIQRETGGYHGLMLAILLIGYGVMLGLNYFRNTEDKYPILYLLFIGITVQFSWETVLLISGIRPLGLSPVLFNSLLETNLGIPYIFFIHRYVILKQHYTIPKETI